MDTLESLPISKNTLSKEIEHDLTKIILSLPKEKQKKFLKRITSEAAYERTLDDLENMRVEELMKLLNAINYRLRELANPINNEENIPIISLSKTSSIENTIDDEDTDWISLHPIQKIMPESSTVTDFSLPKVLFDKEVRKQLLIVMELFECSKNEYDTIKNYILQTLDTEKYDTLICSEEFSTDYEKLQLKKSYDLCIYINFNIQINFNNCIKGTKEIKYFSDIHLENIKNSCRAKHFVYLTVCPKNIWSFHLKQEINCMRREILPLYSSYLGENNINLLTNSIITLFNDLQ